MTGTMAKSRGQVKEGAIAKEEGVVTVRKQGAKGSELNRAPLFAGRGLTWADQTGPGVYGCYQLEITLSGSPPYVSLHAIRSVTHEWRTTALLFMPNCDINEVFLHSIPSHLLNHWSH